MRAARLAAMASMCVLALGAPAQSWYVAASAGMADASGDALADRHALEFNAAATRSASDAHDLWRVGVGRHLDARFAVELNYTDYGRRTLAVSGSPNPIVFPPEVLSESRTSERKVEAVGVDFVARMPVHPLVSLLARLGLAYVSVETISHTVAPGGFPFGSGPQDFSTTARDRSVVPRIAVGAAWTPAPAWDVQLTYEYVPKVGSDFAAGEARTGRSSESALWLGIARRF